MRGKERRREDRRRANELREERRRANYRREEMSGRGG